MSDQNYRHFSIGNVFSQSFSLFAKHIVFFGVTILAIALLYGTWGFFYMSQFDVMMTGNLNNFDINTMLTAYGLSAVFYLAFMAFFNGFVTKTSIGAVREEDLDSGAILSHTISILLPMIGLQFFYGTFMMFGFILLIIPGIIIFLNYYIAAQVKVVEGIGVMKAMERSKELMKGHRLSVFAIFIILYIIFYLTTMIVTGVLAFAIVSPELSSIENNMQATLTDLAFWMQMISSVPYALFIVINIIFSTVIYHQLIADKEGGNVEDVSKVFS